MTAANLTDLAQKISAYEAALVKPQDARVSKKTATENLDREFEEFDNILNNRMDTLSSAASRRGGRSRRLSPTSGGWFR